MNLIEWDGTALSRPGVVLLFGSGLIGGSIADALARQGVVVARSQLAWTWPRPLPEEAQAVEFAARALLAAREGAGLFVIWAAGRSGFASSAADMQSERCALEDVLQIARRIGARCPLPRRNFVHVSSAGGLFEGQVACGPDTEPRPLRPYGHGKLAQEHIIREAADLGRRMIIRPSSVYGYTTGARRGLVSALAATAIRGQFATIFGSITTLRDYLHAQDVGRFVAAYVFQKGSLSEPTTIGTFLLASGRPTSVFEIIGLVEACLGRSLSVRIDPRPENARDNTFLPSSMPRDFRSTPLEVGVAATVRSVSQDRSRGVIL